MAKLAYSKLNAKINTDIVTIPVDEDKNIEVIQYLSVNEKLNLIARIIESAHDIESNFSNPLKTDVYFALEVIQVYTNLSFTEKQLENPVKLYDTLLCSGWIDKIYQAIPAEEIRTLRHSLIKTQNAYYAFRNSAAGILEMISTDYSDLDLDITKLQEKLGKAENLELVKNIVTNLG